MKTTARRSLVEHRAQGFTLVEALLAMGVTSLVVLALVSITMFTGRTFVALYNYVELDDANRTAMDIISRDIRTANRVVSFTTTQFVLEAQNGTTVTYTYTPSAGTVSRVTPSGTRPLLTQCERFNFSICQRTPVGAMSAVFPAADAATAKVINLSWLCSRNILGQRANTESVQTARIVIRKQGPSA